MNKEKKRTMFFIKELKKMNFDRNDQSLEFLACTDENQTPTHMILFAIATLRINFENYIYFLSIYSVINMIRILIRQTRT
jgi:hypothetical protein